MSNWFMEQARLGNVYTASPAANGDFTKLSATSTGLSLENPFGSGKDLIIKSAKFVPAEEEAISESGLCVNPTMSTVVSSTTTAAVIHNARNTGSNENIGVGLAYTIATLPSVPVWLEFQGATILASNLGGYQGHEFKPDGWCIVPPGSYIAWALLTTVTGGIASFVWAEIDAGS